MIHLGNVIHESGVDALHPKWDTMIVLRNTINQPVSARIEIADVISGHPIVCDDILLHPNSCWPASFMPGNGWSNPPQDFRGHATVKCMQSSPFGPIDRSSSILPFALVAMKDWAYGVGVPIRYDVPPLVDVNSPLRYSYPFAYAIPNFNDLDGATARRWVTGVAIENENSTPALCHLNYTIAQTYLAMGSSYGLDMVVPARGEVRFDLYNGDPSKGVPGLLSARYPANLNSEGFVDISSDIPVFPSLIVACEDYSFMVMEQSY